MNAFRGARVLILLLAIGILLPTRAGAAQKSTTLEANVARVAIAGFRLGGGGSRAPHATAVVIAYEGVVRENGQIAPAEPRALVTVCREKKRIPCIHRVIPVDHFSVSGSGIVSIYALDRVVGRLWLQWIPDGWRDVANTPIQGMMQCSYERITLASSYLAPGLEPAALRGEIDGKPVRWIHRPLGGCSGIARAIPDIRVTVTSQ